MRTMNTEYGQKHNLRKVKQRTFDRNWKCEAQDHETVPQISSLMFRAASLFFSSLFWIDHFLLCPPCTSLIWPSEFDSEIRGVIIHNKNTSMSEAAFHEPIRRKIVPCTQCNLITSWLKWARMYVLAHFKTTASFLSSLFWVSTRKPQSHWTHTLYKRGVRGRLLISRLNQSASSDVIGVEKRRNGAVGHTLFTCGDLVL